MTRLYDTSSARQLNGDSSSCDNNWSETEPQRQIIGWHLMGRRLIGRIDEKAQTRWTYWQLSSRKTSYYILCTYCSLASCSSTSWLQDCTSGALASGSDTGMPSWRHPTCDGHWSPSAIRSAAVRTCIVQRTHNSFGDRSFGATGPRVWSSLPPHLRQDMNFARFQHKLKTFLFGC